MMTDSHTYFGHVTTDTKGVTAMAEVDETAAGTNPANMLAGGIIREVVDTPKAAADDTTIGRDAMGELDKPGADGCTRTSLAHRKVVEGAAAHSAGGGTMCIPDCTGAE